MADTVYSWDSTINSDENTSTTSFEPLPEGDYEFTVRSVTKKMFNGSAKMPACPQASVEVLVMDPKTHREISIFTNLFLVSTQEWKLVQFFKSIGVMGLNDKDLKMRWDIEGEIGKCHIAPREYNGKIYNDIKKWIAPEPKSDTDDLPF